MSAFQASFVMCTAPFESSHGHSSVTKGGILVVCFQENVMKNSLVQAAPQASEKLLFLRLLVNQDVQFQRKWWLEKKKESAEKMDHVGTERAELAS